MQTKLHINVSQGIIDIEGDIDLVREIYADFKDRLLDGLDIVHETPTQNGSSEQGNKTSPKRKKRTSSKRAVQTDNSDSGIDPDHPKLDKDLDLSGLRAFYDQFEPKNNAEKILIFAKFLIDTLKQSKPNTDQFYTCFIELDEMIPSAFAQAFRNTHGRKYGYIEYKSATDISVPIKGTNHYTSGIKRKGTE